MEELSVSTCWHLMCTVEVGRLAFGVGDRIEIFPVNFAIDGESVLFRTAEGTKLAATVLDHEVALETDAYDDLSGRAWSVVVHGRASEVTDPDELEDLATLPLYPWSSTEKNRFVRITPLEVSGRRFRVTETHAPLIG
ncbi:pyridoxamine 5'-phosphate oxidase family protein [Spongisporangium articulatum]|uniref:Pyridoxamine 5'-phosphate oxidase family protein n=1 Tax=Spongisporangium articulatum TaxID=3362603 RepID=A0ABW8AQG3_9ACTN